MRSGLRSSLVFVSALAVVLCTPGPVEARLLAPAKRGGYERAMAEAGALVDEGKHGAAVERFATAFEAMPADVKVGDVGEFVVYSAAEAALQQFALDGDVATLERGKALVASFHAEVARAKPGTPVASLDRTKAILADMESRSQPEPEPALEPEPELEPVPEPTPEVATEPRRRDRVGLALVVSGSVVATGGLALVVAGARQVPWYEDKLDEYGWTPGSPDYDYEAKLDEARRVRNIDMGLGAALTAVGLGLTVYGAVRMTRVRSRATVSDRVTVSPFRTVRGGGMALTGRF